MPAVVIPAIVTGITVGAQYSIAAGIVAALTTPVLGRAVIR